MPSKKSQKVAIQQHSDSSDSENDAPEAVNLSQSKKDSRQRERNIANAEAHQKEQKRAKNRERDRRLKEQAEERKRKELPDIRDDGSDEDDVDPEQGEDNDVLARMERAMKEAQGEEGVDSDADGDDVNESELEDGDGSDEEGSERGDGGDDEDGSGTELDGSSSSLKRKRNPNHLPDELFTAAFSGVTQTKRKQESSSHESQKAPNKRRKHSHPESSHKDMVLGSRVIRNLNSTTTSASAAASKAASAGKGTMPSRKVRKFVDRTLALKSAVAKSRGWERRPAHLGVLRTSGPAANFVR
ncbi:hypothetical protein BDN72DRAFT_846789, partial [Pluteus cervinus]